MCGRFVSYFDPAELAGVFDADRITELPAPSWNVAPTNQVPMVRELAQATAPDSGPAAETLSGLGEDGSEARAGRLGRQDPGPSHPRELRGARWGLVPSWAKDPSIGSRLINARSETITVKPSFRSAAKSRRALIPAAGYFEWQASGHGGKTPFFLHPEDEGIIAMAGLYEWWLPPSDPLVQSEDPSVRPEPLVTFTVVTRAATDSLGGIHDRMPLVVPPELWEAWLSPDLNAPAAVNALIESIPDPELIPREVSRAVGSVRNNGPHLINPAAGRLL
ncbi:MAG: SOS response-associated peptidase [Bifidobacteriaceae bacterium]|jgi:putative SOS response-associated peptidase YedK|nr:SOS response-associated peptidase [Bifidobacteriaceae bacterium]